MTAPVLRPYQIEAVTSIRSAYADGASRVLFQLPTGGGKTVAFAHILAGAAQRGKRVLVLAHRVEIIEQIEAAIALAGVSYGKIAAGWPETDAPVQVASVATLAQPKRLARWAGRFDFIVVDETHHVVAGSWARVLASQPNAKILGVSATPQRLDGKGFREHFDTLVIGPQTGELIKAGWLAPFTVFEPIAGGPDMSGAKIRGGDYAVEDQRKAMGGVVIGAAVAEYKRICAGVPAVAFCVDIQHSEELAQRFRAAGVRAIHIDGETPATERRAAIAGLADGSLDVLCNCGLISEGVDVPAIGVAILLRPTASLALYLQQVGRALRPAPGKERALILDFSGNTARHGLPDEPREWSLDSKPVKQRERGEPGLRRCGSCRALNRPNAHTCAQCGADLRTHRERQEIEVRLRETQAREEAEKIRGLSYPNRLAWAGADEQRLRLVARASGFKPGWVFYRLRDLAEKQRERAMATMQYDGGAGQ